MSFGSASSLCRSGTPQASTSSKLLYVPGSQISSTRCCETGRPVMVDPLTGSNICSCQLKSNVPAYLSRVPSLTDSIYRSSSSQVFQSNPALPTDSVPPFFAMGMKADRPAETHKPSLPGGPSPFYLDHLMTHPYNPFSYHGFDLNMARRKNATRETTSALKAWLYEHRKNPYPTKGEKIMLAIITRMTLTQVSTWFANARRRLKKENKLDDKDGTLSDIDLEERPGDPDQLGPDDDDVQKETGDLSDISDVEDSPQYSNKQQLLRERLFPPSSLPELASNTFLKSELHITTRHVDIKDNKQTPRDSAPRDNKQRDDVTIENVPRDSTPQDNNPRDSSRCDGPLPRGTSTNETPPQNSRPKIWSISEIISNTDKTNTD